MPDGDGSSLNFIGIVLVFVLVAANEFFVDAEFSLVAVRPSRVAELVAGGSRRALVLQRAIQHLDANLAVTQLGITISSLALGWIGEPALAGLIQPLLKAFPDSIATAGAHAVAVVVSFSIITTLQYRIGRIGAKEPGIATKRKYRACDCAAFGAVSAHLASSDRCAEWPWQPDSPALRPAARNWRIPHCTRPRS